MSENLRQFNLDEHKVWEPHDYQKRSVQFLLQNPGAALFLDPGLGKTSIVLSALRILKARVGETALVIAPLRVCYSVWPMEAAKWSQFRGMQMEVLHGPGKDKALLRKADVYVINPEGLPWLLNKMQRYGKTFNNLIIDESTKFKNTNTVRFRMLDQILHTFGRRWILTGTPTSNSLLSLYGQMYIVDRGKSLGPSFYGFQKRYFADTGAGPKPRKFAMREITDRIAPVALRLSAEEYLSLPEIVESNIMVDLPPKARKVYNDLETKLLAELLTGEKVKATNAGVLTIKCKQVANGAIYTGEKIPGVAREWQKIHDAKLEALEELVEELGGEGAIIAYNYSHDRDRIRHLLGKDIPFIGGGVSAKSTQKIADEWNAKKTPILLGNPAAMSHGLNLQEGGNHIIWFSITSNWEEYDQFVRRVRRQGSQHSKVFVYNIMARDTVDILMSNYRTGRETTQNKFFSRLKEYLLAKQS